MSIASAFRSSLALLVLFAACKSSETTPSASSTPPPATTTTATPPAGSSPAPASSTKPPPVNIDPEVFPDAVGDPCRGEPVANVTVAEGLCARRIAPNIAVARQIEFAPNGDLFVATRSTQLYLLRDENGDGVFSDAEQHLFATIDGYANNVHLDGGFVYVGAATKVVRYPWDGKSLTPSDPQTIVQNLPTSGHGAHTVHVYDGFLYVQYGSVGNATNETSTTEYDTERSLVRRYDLSQTLPFDWKGGEIVTQGVRNTNGFKRNETTKRIYGVVNGMDSQTYDALDVHDDNPGEQIVEIAKGTAYGFPFCFTAQRVVVGGNLFPVGSMLHNSAQPAHDDAWCAVHATPPVSFIQAHSAPLDLVFFDRQAKGVLPEKWRGGAFIALHGSTYRTVSTGQKVVWLKFNADGTAPQPTSTVDTTTFPYETVFGGPNDGDWGWSGEARVRPSGVTIGPADGALYIVSDYGGGIYRVGLAPQ